MPDTNSAEIVKKYLESYHSTWETRLGEHIKARMKKRAINIQTLWNCLDNPKNLETAIKQNAKRKAEEKYRCYFKISGQQYYVCILVFNFKHKFINLVTIFKDRPQLQRKVQPTRGRL